MNIAELLPAILLGAIAGSFLSTVPIRWGSLGSLTGRSRCDLCQSPIPARANIPLVSFVLLRGRCAACGGRIDPAHIVMEIACAAIGGIALAIQPGASGWIAASFGWTLALLALIDAREFRLPDVLVLPLGLAGLIVGAADFAPSLMDRAIGLVAGYASLRLIALAYRISRGRDGLGHGDAKLLGAIGAWTGWQGLPQIVLAAAILGLGWVALRFVRGHAVSATDRLPLGTLLAPAAWTVYIAFIAAGNLI